MRSFATTNLVFISLYKMLYNSEKVRDALPYKTTYLLRHYLSKWNAFLVLMASFHEFMKHSNSRESNVNSCCPLFICLIPLSARTLFVVIWWLDSYYNIYICSVVFLSQESQAKCAGTQYTNKRPVHPDHTYIWNKFNK